MHFYLWVSLAGSCLLYPGLSILGGGDGAGSREHGAQRHHGGRGSGIRDRRRATSATPTTAVAAFAVPLLLGRRARAGGSCSSSTATAAAALRRQALLGPAEAVISGVVRRHHHQQQKRLPYNINNGSIRQHHSRAAAAAARLRPRQSATPTLLAARVDPDGDDDFYSDRGRVEPPAMAQRSGRPPVRRINNNASGRGGGRPGSGAGRGVSVRGSGVSSSGGGSGIVDPATSGRGRGGAGGRGRGIDQNDPLIRDWQSAQVLAGKGGGGRGAGGERGERRYVQDSAGRGGGGRGRGEGRGGGRGRGRGRGRGHNKTPVEIYVGSDTVPWYIKEVQDKGLDTQGEFSRWWQSNADPEANAASVKGMKVDELKAQLERMELPTTGRKAELAQRLTDAYLRCSLSDDNFRHAQVTDVSANDEDLPNCFPQVYEKASEAELEKLWRESRKKGQRRT